MRALRSVMLGICASLAPSCGEITFVAVTPPLQSLEFARPTYDSGDNPILHVLGTLAGQEPLAEGEFIALTLSSSSGQTIDVRLETCRTPDDYIAACHEVLATLESGRSGDDLAPLLEGLDDAKFIPVTMLSGDVVGVIHLFSDRVTEEVVERVRNDPHVRLASFNTVISVPIVGAPQPEMQPFALVPTRIEATGRDDCFLIAPGDVITATYTNPDGSTLTATTLIQ